MDDFDYETEVTFANIDYIVSVSVYRVSSFDPECRIIIDVESKMQGLIWRGDYKQKYVEEITNKAGSFKKFSVFMKMLVAALKREQSEEVIIDLLTQQDLAMIKARKQNPGAQVPDSLDHTTIDPSMRRYLILTLNGEFEKVHYPLPLSYLEEPDIATLRRTFQRMHSEVDLMQNSRAFTEMLPPSNCDLMAQSMGDFADLEDQNANMRNELDQMEQFFAQTDNDFFKKQRETLEMESQLESFQQNADNEINELGKVVQAKESELMQLQHHLDKARGTHQSGFGSIHGQSMGVGSEAESVRTQLVDLQQELESEQRRTEEVISKQNLELTEAKSKAAEGDEATNKIKARMADLQTELEQTIKRIEQVQRGGGGFGARANARLNFSGASNNSRKSSNASRGVSNGSQNRANRFNAPSNRPVPNYMRPRGQTNSADRGGSGARSNSNNRNNRFLPGNYKPPHLRDGSNTRVSPNVRQPGAQSSGYGPNNRVSPGTRVAGGAQPPTGPARRSPGSRLYANVPSRLHNPAPRVARTGASPVVNLSAERRAGIKPPPQSNRFGVDYRGQRNTGAGVGANRSNSRDRVPKVNNFTKPVSRISPARAEADAAASNGNNAVHNRLYGRSKPGQVGGRSASNEARQVNQPAAKPVPRGNFTRQFGSQSRIAPSSAQPKMVTQNARTASTRNIKPTGAVVPTQKPMLAKDSASGSMQQLEAAGESDNIDSKLNRLQDLLKMAKKN